MSRWEDLLDIQLDVHRFLTSENGRLFGAGWFASTFRDYSSEDRGRLYLWATEQEAEYNGMAWAQQTGVSAFNAEPIWVDPDMMTLVEAAVQTFKPEPLAETDLITREGFLVLPRPLWLGVAPGREELDVRLNWSIAHWRVREDGHITGRPGNEKGPGIMLCLYHDNETPDELDTKAGAEVKRRFHTRWWPTHVVNWVFGENHPSITDGTLTQLLPQSAMSGAHDVQLQTQAIWRLLNQTIAVREPFRPPRSFMKRALKAKMTKEHVTVVRLRRPSGPPKEGEPTQVAWTHRWIVGGHWRWQWYRDDDRVGPCGHIDPSGQICMAHGGLHRQIWISPFTKGPEGLDLIVSKARIFVLER